MVLMFFKKDGEKEEEEAPSGGDSEDLMPFIGLFILAKLSKTPEGLTIIKDWGKEFIKGLSDTLHALAQASAANKVSAWANPYLIGSILRRFGFLTQFDIVQFRVGLSTIAGAVVAEGYLDTIQGFFPFTKPEPSEFPSQIVFSAREAGVEVPKEISWTEVAELMRARKLYRAPRKKKGK